MLDVTRIDDAVKYEGGVSRRLFLAYAAALSAVPLLGRAAGGAMGSAVVQRPRFANDPFTLGVASGDPDAQGFVLWTRLATDTTLPDGGMPAESVAVSWEVAGDEGMTKIVRSGKTTASKELAHSVHIELTGLEPDRWYWYRFRSGDATSPVGRARTLPAATVMPSELNFAFASCQHWESGLYTAYQHMAEDNLDLVFHLGDYIYEGAPRKLPAAATQSTQALRQIIEADKPISASAAKEKGKGAAAARKAATAARGEMLGRRHSPTEAGGILLTLTDYRLRHAQYRSDPHLQAAHARCPWFVTWDDHEVVNNYANDIDGTGKVHGAEFLKRRAAAYQAYYEMMPLRARSLPKGPDMQLYRGGSYGQLAELHVLDTRQFRSDQPNGDKAAPLNEAAMAESQSIMGSTQKSWLKDRLVKSPGTWNVVAQQVMMGMLRRHPAEHPEEDVYSMDSWTGYTHERIEMVKFMKERGIKNPVVLTGDVHANYVNDLRVDDRQAETAPVAAEFVGTSITSGGDGQDVPAGLDKLLSDNPGLKYHNRERGYVRCKVTPGTWTSDYVTVPQVSEPGATSTVRAKFVVEAGKAGIQKA